MALVSEEEIETVAERLRDVFGERLERIVLYGSYARGEQTPGSDVDLLVLVTEKHDGDRRRAFDAAKQFVAEGKLFSPRVYSIEEYGEKHAEGNRFVRNVEQEGVKV